jgi:hypothetical protein
MIAASMLFLVVLVVSIPWAWRNYSSGHADMRGAARLAFAVSAAALLTKVLRVPEARGFTGALSWLMVGSFYAAGVGTLMAAFYLALERHARKYWPDKLVTWTRAVNLRWADPALREHILAGIALGVIWALLAAAERHLVSWMTWPLQSQPETDRISERLLGMRPLTAGLIDIVPPAILYGLLFMLVLVVAQRLVLNRRLATAIAFLVLVFVLVPRGAHPYTSWAFFGLGCGSLCVWAMMRFGLLTLVAGLFVLLMLNTTPMSLDLTAWHADAELIVLGLVVLGVIYGVSARPIAMRPEPG